jgi:DNA-binding XRE family transcriptional regulator
MIHEICDCGQYVVSYPWVDIHEVMRMRRWAKTGVARQLRQEAGLSLAEMAQAVGASRSALHFWETGQRVPRPDNAARWAEVLEGLFQESR